MVMTVSISNLEKSIGRLVRLGMLGIEKDAVRPLLLPPFFFLFFFVVGFAVFAAVATKPPETSSGADVAKTSVKHVTQRNSVVMHFMIDYDDGKRKENRNL